MLEFPWKIENTGPTRLFNIDMKHLFFSRCLLRQTLDGGHSTGKLVLQNRPWSTLRDISIYNSLL